MIRLVSRNVSGRVLSTRITSPNMPSERISHIKSKRFCPGVPNRCNTRSSATAMRPKSIATVVSFLISLVSSVARRSVETTSISLIALMNSVLPAFTAPLMTIFTVCTPALRCGVVPYTTVERPERHTGVKCAVWALATTPYETLHSANAVNDSGNQTFFNLGRLGQRPAGCIQRHRPGFLDHIDQPSGEETIDDPADIEFAQAGLLRDLSQCILAIDSGEYAPFLRRQVHTFGL